MYQQIKPTETFRERELALLKEGEKLRLLGRRLRARREPIGKSTVTASGLLAALVVAGLILVALSSSPAHADTTFIVNSTADLSDVNTLDNVCDADFASGNLCTLRAAIEQANATLGPDAIHFDIPDASGTGVKTFFPSTSLPTITEDVTIDGYTQGGANPNTLAKGTNAQPKIELDGSNIPTTSRSSTGLEVVGTHAVIRGLVINRFRVGVSVIGGAQGVSIEGNFIGTDPTGTFDEGNSNAGILIAGGSTNITFVGATTPEARNLISGNDGHGISIGFAGKTRAEGNLIGTDRSGTKDLGNSATGVDISSASETNVERNTIAFNGSAGVVVEFDGGANAIHNNSIFSNGGLGIDLRPGSASGPVVGKTPNDLGDADTGPNGLQNFPVLTSAKTVSGETTIKGKLNSTQNVSYVVQFFTNPSGNEGKKFIGQKEISTDASGNASFTFSPNKKVALGQRITATASGAVSRRALSPTAEVPAEAFPFGNTSEFSAPKKVVAS
jgi:CSLREA domain-containing protein